MLPKPSVVRTCPLSPSSPLINNLPDFIFILPVESILKDSVDAVPKAMCVPVEVVPIERLLSDITD